VFPASGGVFFSAAISADCRNVAAHQAAPADPAGREPFDAFRLEENATMSSP
jgi:hypothetical protein